MPNGCHQSYVAFKDEFTCFWFGRNTLYDINDSCIPKLSTIAICTFHDVWVGAALTPEQAHLFGPCPKNILVGQNFPEVTISRSGLIDKALYIT
ncbi:hypothetical protein GGR94_003088 [Sulfitobacter geojensis]|nr:hypothetical protein [Sulfitobacter geojensis]